MTTKVIYPDSLTRDADIEERTEAFFTNVWLKTIKESHLTTLVRQGIYCEAKNADGMNALNVAACYGKTAVVEALLAAAGAEIENRDYKGDTPLINAAFWGHSKIVDALLAAGANIETRGEDGRTALMRAASNNNITETTTLINRGANLYARSVQNGPAIEYNEPVLGTAFGVWERQHHQFVTTHKPPKTAEAVYQILAMTPLADPYATVDYVGNLRRIFTHAKWENKEQAKTILKEMHKDSMISAATCESILAATFPHEQTRARRPQPRSEGMAI